MDGIGESFLAGLAEGGYGLGESFGSFLDFLGMAGGKEVEDYFRQRASQYQLAKDLQGYVWDKPELLKSPEWWAHGIGSVIPSIAASVLPGAAAFKGAQALKWARPAMAAAAASGLAGGTLEGLGTYQAAREKGLDYPRLRGLGAGLATGALNALPAYQLFKPLTGGLGAVPGKILAQGLSEGLTEAAEEPIQSVLEGGTLAEGAKAGLNVFFPSAITGGFLGGGVQYQHYANEEIKQGRMPKGYATAIYAGEGAKTANTAMLETALQLEKAGTDPELVRQKTGWFRGPEDKWRFEIDDSQLALTDKPGQDQPLENIIRHPDLFKAYPQLKNVRVHFNELGMAKDSGQYQKLTYYTEGFKRGGKKIYRVTDTAGHIYQTEFTDPVEARAAVAALNASKIGVIRLQSPNKSTLLHEIQHVVQGIEGFARGGSPQEFIKQVSTERDKIIIKNLEMVKAGLLTREEAHQLSRKEFKDITPEQDRYRSLAGEIEARDTAARAALSAEERTISEPYVSQNVPRETMIVKQQEEGIQAAEPINPDDLFRRFMGQDVTQPSHYGSVERLAKQEDIYAAATRALEAAAPEAIEAAKRGKISIAEQERLANTLGADPKTIRKFLERKPGDVVNAESMRLIVRYAENETQQFQNHLKEYFKKQDAGTLTEQDKADLEKHMLGWAYVQSQMLGTASELGRALGTLAHIEKERGVIDFKDMHGFFEKYGGEVGLEDMLQLMRGLVEGDPANLNKFTRQAMSATKMDMLFEAWVNGLLSGTQTHVVNMTSNALVAVNDNIVRWVAATIGKLHGGDKVSFTEAARRTMAVPQAFTHGIKLFKQAMQDESFGVGLSKLEGYKAAIPGKTGKVVRLPGRFLNAEDALFKGMSYASELAAQVQRHIDRHGGNFDELFDSLLNKDTNNPEFKRLQKNAWQMAERATFTEKMGMVGTTIQRLKHAHPTLGYIMPFVRTPTNIIKYFGRHSPFGVLMQDVRDDLIGKNGKVNRDLAAARMLWGGGLMTSMAMLAAQGLVTGGGPDDPKERQVLYAQGWQPYSLKIGDKYYAYGRLEPLGMLFGVAADMRAIAHVASQGEMDEIGSLVLGSLNKNLTSKTWIRGAVDVMHAITDPDRYGESYIRNLIGTIVPTGVAQIARTMDPMLRRSDDILSAIKRRIPGQSQNVLPKLDLWGQPVQLEGGVGPDILSPIYVSTKTGDVVADALRVAEYSPSRLSNKVFGRELDPEMHNKYIQMARQPAYQFLTRMVQSPGWRALNQETQKEFMEKVVKKYARQARRQLLMQHPEIFIQ